MVLSLEARYRKGEDRWGNDLVFDDISDWEGIDGWTISWAQDHDNGSMTKVRYHLQTGSGRSISLRVVQIPVDDMLEPNDTETFENLPWFLV